MQILNAESFDQVIIDLDDSVNAHQDLISGLAANDQGTFLVSCLIDSTVRVWDFQTVFRFRQTFQGLVQRHGCPIQSRVGLTGHIGWVNGSMVQYFCSFFNF